MPLPRLRLNVIDANFQQIWPVTVPESGFDVIVTYDETSGDAQLTKTPGLAAWDDMQGLLGLRSAISRDNRTLYVLIENFHRFLETNRDDWMTFIEHNRDRGTVYWTAEISMEAYRGFQEDEKIRRWLSTWTRIDRRDKGDWPNDGVLKVLIGACIIVVVAVVLVVSTGVFPAISRIWTSVNLVLHATQDFVRSHLEGVLENLIADVIKYLILLVGAWLVGRIILEVQRWFRGRKGRNTNEQHK